MSGRARCAAEAVEQFGDGRERHEETGLAIRRVLRVGVAPEGHFGGDKPPADVSRWRRCSCICAPAGVA
jgi:hypothetical protein